MDRSKDAVARRLADAHFSVEPGIQRIFRLLADDALESDSKEPVKLLEVNQDTIAEGIRPVLFGPRSNSGIFYSSIIVEVTPEEFEQIRSGSTALPDNWRLGSEISRGAAMAEA